MSKQRALIRREWANKIEQWKLSGKSIRTWCLENQIVYVTFIGWRNRFRKAEIEKSTQSSCIENQFLELKDVSNISSNISLEYEGIIIHLKGEFNVALLKTCLNVLRGFPC